jgi:hypothetical protein
MLASSGGKPLVNHALRQIPPQLAAEVVAIVDEIDMTALSLHGVLAEPERSARIGAALDHARSHEGDMGIAVFASIVGAQVPHVDSATATELVAEALAV